MRLKFLLTINYKILKQNKTNNIRLSLQYPRSPVVYYLFSVLNSLKLLSETLTVKDDTNKNISSLKLRINTISEVGPSFEIQIFENVLRSFFHCAYVKESNKMIYEVSLNALSTGDF